MSDVMDKWILRSEKILYGYIRTRVFMVDEIPRDIKNLCVQYYHIEERWNIKKVHESIELSNDAMTATKTGLERYRSVYGSVGIDSKQRLKYQWKLTVTKRALDSIIGIGANPDINIKRSYTKISYGYQTYGGDKWIAGDNTDYGIEINSGEELIINVDFKKEEIGFIANGKDQGVAFKNIAIGPVYYLVASLNMKEECITINDFKCID